MYVILLQSYIYSDIAHVPKLTQFYYMIQMVYMQMHIHFKLLSVQLAK